MEKVKGHVLAGFTGMAGRRPKKSTAGLRKVSVLRTERVFQDKPISLGLDLVPSLPETTLEKM